MFLIKIIIHLIVILPNSMRQRIYLLIYMIIVLIMKHREMIYYNYGNQIRLYNWNNPLNPFFDKLFKHIFRTSHNK